MQSQRPVRPGRVARGRTVAPPSKSVTQRALLAAALASGRSIIRRALVAEDSAHLITALSAVGVGLRRAGAGDEGTVEVDGCGGVISAADATLNVGNAGTAMRFLTAVLATGGGRYVIDGDARMRTRPIGDLLEALRGLGARAEAMLGNDSPPVRVGGGMPGGETRLRGGKSSQYLSAILLAAPAAGGAVQVDIEGDLVSRPYVDLTLRVMQRFGVRVASEPPGRGARRFRVEAGAAYAARDFTVEGDYSSASYFFAAAALTGGRVEVAGLDPASAQGDARLLDLLEAMGCRVERWADTVVVEGAATLRGIDADCGAMPDIVPTLAVTALFADRETRVRGVPHLRYKETDRIAALVTEIGRLGGEARATADGLIIVPRPLSGVAVDTYGDHRMAMAFAVAGLRVPGVAINDPGCVAKSYPGFWEAFDKVVAG